MVSNDSKLSYRATALIVENFIDKKTGEAVEMDVGISFGNYPTQAQAENVAQSADICIGTDTNEKECIVALIYDDEKKLIDKYYIKDEDCALRKNNAVSNLNNSSLPNLEDAAYIEKSLVTLSLNNHDLDDLKNDDLDLLINDIETIEDGLDHFISHFKVGKTLHNVSHGWTIWFD